MPNIVNINSYQDVYAVPSQAVPLAISFVGRLSPEKNLFHLLKAVHVLVLKGYNIKLSLIGSSANKPYVEQLIQLIDELKLGNVVAIRPAVKNVLDVYRQTHLLCLVSIFEGFSNVLSEAICSGIPVIASDIPENRFLVEDGVNGFLADPASYESIAHAIEQFLLLNDAAKATISANNKAKAKELFDEERIYQQYLDIFKEIEVA